MYIIKGPHSFNDQMVLLTVEFTSIFFPVEIDSTYSTVKTPTTLGDLIKVGLLDNF